MKLVTAVRHAKSDWETGLPDIERPLAGRGKRNAPEMGRRLHDRGVVPDLMISSPAERAFKTASLIALELGFPHEDIVVNNDLYGAGPATMFAVLSEVPADVGHVMFYTHNPGITAFANRVPGVAIDNVPTCGVVQLAFEIDDWAEIAAESGRLIEFDYPKKSAV